MLLKANPIYLKRKNYKTTKRNFQSHFLVLHKLSEVYVLPYVFTKNKSLRKNHNFKYGDSTLGIGR